MFGHVTKQLTAYCHGELTPQERQPFETHVARCARCRKELEGVRFAVTMCQGALVPVAMPGLKEATIPAFRRHSFLRPGLVAAFTAAVIVVMAAGAYRIYQNGRPSWEVDGADGATSRLRVGQLLETNGTSEATVKIAEIGQIQVEPNTRLRLLETRPGEHRIKLERGTMHAQVWAPPRLFFTETPTATAIDLGCAYTLKVDDSGQSLLYVTVGLVELESSGRSSTVPAGNYARTRQNAGPGTPYTKDASAEMQHAIDVIDFEHDVQARTAALDLILSEAQAGDLVTLWHLLPRVDAEGRARIYTRMLALDTPPDGVTADGIIKLDPEMLSRWKSRLGLVW